MDNLTIYYIGVGISFILGMSALVFTTDTDSGDTCNINNLSCFMVMTVLSLLLNWLMVILFLGILVRQKVKGDK